MLDRHRAPDRGPHAIVAGEHRHHAIADELVHFAAVALDEIRLANDSSRIEFDFPRY